MLYAEFGWNGPSAIGSEEEDSRKKQTEAGQKFYRWTELTWAIIFINVVII